MSTTETPAAGPVTPRRVVAGWAAAATLIALGALAWALSAGGGAERAAAGFEDGGATVAWGLPIARLIGEGAAVLALGALIAALVFSPRGPGGSLSGPSRRFARATAYLGLVWTFFAAAQILLTAADLMGRPVSAVSATALSNTALTVAQGRAQLIAAVAGLIIFGCAWLATRPGLLVVALLAAVAGVLPAAFAGHAASSLDHNIATTSLAAHILFAALWVGGLAMLPFVARWDRPGLALAARRFSTLAAVCFGAVAATGLLNAWLRVGSIENLSGTGYGILLQVKVLALLVLGGFGWWHRQHLLPKLGADGGPFVRFATVELLIMAATVGVAVGLSRSQAPGVLDISGLTEADALLGYPMPGPPSTATLLFDWRPDLFYTAACAVAAALYLLGLHRLRRAGIAWPVHRTACWLGGLAVVFLATSGGLARYAPVLFSVHMIAHMLTAMLAPILLVLGAPITLALRALPAGGSTLPGAEPDAPGAGGKAGGKPGAPTEMPGLRADVRYPGPREWITAALHSRYAQIITHPVVAAVLWVGGLYVMYFTGAYEYALRNHPAHLAMYAHFILSGYLFFAILIGPDPLPRRPGYPARMVLLLASLVFHAFFGVALMTQNNVIAADWFAELARPWGDDPLADQKTGGGIAWAVGEAPAILVALVLFRQWIRDDEREQRRIDRAADRDGDAALAAYNEWLGRTAAAEGRSPQPDGEGRSPQPGGEPPAVEPPAVEPPVGEPRG